MPLALVAGKEIEQLLARLVALDDGIGNVRPIERGGKNLGLFEPQTFNNIFACRRIGRGRQRNARYAGEQFHQVNKLAIFRPEIVPPLAHAVRLIDGKQRNIDARKHIGKARRRHPFRRHIEQVQFPGPQLPAHQTRLFRRAKN